MSLQSLLQSMAENSGVRLDAATFESRLCIQKLVYVLAVLGHPDATPYLSSFNLYVNGPYSPSLSKAYFAIKEGRHRDEAGNFSPPVPGRPLLETEAIGLEMLKLGPQFMEATATLLKVHRDNRGGKRAEILDVVKGMKPHLGDDALEGGMKFLETHRIVAASI